MTELMARHFLPVVRGLGKEYAPRIYDSLFPPWAAEQCPMPYTNLRISRGDIVTLFWPATSLVILSGLLTCWLLGSRLLVRCLRDGARARQGLFLTSLGVLAYGFMCLGGFFFHCFHIRPMFHMLDMEATGLASLCFAAAFAAYSGLIDDRTSSQRLKILTSALGFILIDLYSPSFLQEQFYLAPAAGAVASGGVFLLRSFRAQQKSAQQAQGLRDAQFSLMLSATGVVVAVAAIPLDKYLCVALGSEFVFLFWFFLGCNCAVAALYRFAVVVAEKNVQFTDVRAD